jgi:PAS domain S-box-containing protein
MADATVTSDQRDVQTQISQFPELELIYDTTPVGLAFLSPDCRYLRINRRMTEICGISAADHIGRTVRETVPRIADQVETIVETVLSTGESLTGIEINGQRIDGLNAEHFWLTNWYPLKGQDGSIVGISIVSEEITERKRAAAELAAAEDRLRSLNANLEQRVDEKTQERNQIWNVCQDLLVICDLEGKFLDINPAWASTLGWTTSELLGKTSEWLIHPDEREKAHAETESLASGRRTRRFELRFREKSGSYRVLSWEAVPHQGRIYAMARDVTEQRHAEVALQESRRELAQVTRHITLAAMTASIAHEISQPLVAIAVGGDAGLRWLERAEPDIERARSALKLVVDASHRATDIITSIRAMFRKDSYEKRPINVNDLVSEVLALVRSELQLRRAMLQIELAEQVPQITVEHVPLQQVLLNLIMNGLDAMTSIEDRDRLLSIKSEWWPPGGVLISVADTGTGIDPKNMDRIFEPFFTTKSQGLGVGLSICRSIVEAHSGRLWASNGSPHGSVFHVQLPGDPNGGR